LGLALLVALLVPEAAEGSARRRNQRREAAQREARQRGAREDYDRDLWPHWIDADGDCQNTRQELLLALSLEPVTFKGKRPCQVLRGLWRDAYSGELIANPGKLDVDHVVPLAEAYRSGGFRWSIERRRAFANDPFGLALTRKSLNRAKGDRDPATWLPPAAELRCGYVQRWVEIKKQWELELDSAEREAIGRACP
jgi:hypothetical protein